MTLAGFAPVGFGDWLWQDSNGNGLQDNDEAGLGGVKVDLYDTNNNPIQCTETGVYDTYADQFNSGVSNGSTGRLQPGVQPGGLPAVQPRLPGAGNPGGSLYVYGATTSRATRAVNLALFGSNPTLSFDYISRQRDG